MALTFSSKIEELIPEILKLNYFKDSPQSKNGALIGTFFPGKGKLLVITGENASGKSFFRRLLTQALRQNREKMDIEVMPLSLQGRTASGNPIRGLIYGGEEDSSTGSNSATTVATAIKTCQGRQTFHAVIFDEPDIGLSDSYAAGVGTQIAEFADNPPEHTVLIGLVSHRKCLLEQIKDLNPHHLHLGEDIPENLAGWLSRPIVPKKPELLQKENLRMLRAILKYEPK